MHTVAKILIIIGVILAVIVAAGAVLLYTVINEIEDQMGINRSTEELDRMLIKDATYADLVEDTDSYIGQVVKETGQIISIEDLSFGGLTYLVDSGNNEYYTLYDDQIVDDAERDYVLFYGTVAGSGIIQLESGNSVSVIGLNVEDIVIADTPFN